MLDHFKSLLTDNVSTQTVVNQLSKIQWVYSLNTGHLEQLTKIVQGKISSYKLHPKVSTTLYSILIMRDHKSYNPKHAIQTLSKYYRQLCPSQQQSTTATTPTTIEQRPANKTRIVVANLLLKIPTFSNYKMIIRDICPQLTSFSLFMEHRNAIMKQCPNLYREFVSNVRNCWPGLVVGDQSSFQIGQLFAQIGQAVIRLSKQQDIVKLYKQYYQVDKTIDFLRSRIKLSQNQQLNIQSLFTHFPKILQTQPIDLSPTLTHQFLQTQSKHIKNIKNSCVQLLRLIIIKYKYYLCRKFKDIYEIIDNLRNQKGNNWDVQPVYYVGILGTALEVYGMGSMNFQEYLGKEDNDVTSIITLISALCYNDYSMNNKQQQTKINHQAQQKGQKQQKQIHLHLYTSTSVDSSYENYLKKTTEKQRDKLLHKILQFLTIYFNAKLNCSKDLYKSSQILHILGTSKNCISDENLKSIQDLKKNVLFRGFKKIGEGFQGFCSEVFQKFIKKKQQRKNKISKSVIQIAILPTVKPSNTQILPQISRTNSQQNNQLRRTNSFDVELEGWGSHHKNQKRVQEKHKQDKQQKSQMFYSIKQCSQLEEKDKKNQQAEPENTFLLTPQF